MSEHHPSSRSPRVAVIGGGVSGLAAAHRLLRLLPHAQVSLFEASGRLGGPLHTLRTSDKLLEQGADSFLIKTPWALELCRELGLAEQLVPTNEQHRRALVVRSGKLLPVPEGFVLMRPHSVAAMLRSPVLSAKGKARLLLEPFMRRPPAALDPEYDESVASFATRRLGREAYERLVQPLIAGIFVADARRLSLAATYPEFLQAEREHGSLGRSLRTSRQAAGGTIESRDSAGSPSAAGARYGQFVTLRYGIHSLIEALANSLPAHALHLATPVESVTAEADHRWNVRSNDDNPPKSFDGVIIATSAPIAARLLNGVDNQLPSELSRIEYASSAVVTLVYKRAEIPHPLDGFGVVVPAIENRPIVAASFLTVKFPDHAPHDQAVIRVFLGGVLQPELVDRADRELTMIAQQELTALIGARNAPIETHVVRWRDAMPQYHVGHLRQMQTIERLAAAIPHVELAGSAYRGVGIPQCIHSGQEAAERLVESLNAVPKSH